jgi:arginine exporter protein ArgO
MKETQTVAFTGEEESKLVCRCTDTTFLNACLSLRLCCHDKTLTKNSMGRKGFIWLTGYCLLSIEAKTETQGRNLRQELEQKPWRNIAYWPSSLGLLNYRSYTAQAYLPKDNTAHSGLGSPTSISN